MSVKVVITGLDEIKRTVGSAGKQAAFAASKALNTTAFAVNGKIKEELQRRVQGGAAPYTLRAFKVDKATKQTLVATVALRADGPSGGAGGGTPYDQALAHLFTGGARRWKRVEGYLRSIGVLPAGLMAVPGKFCPLDARGNIPRSAFRAITADLAQVGPSRRTRAIARQATRSTAATAHFVATASNPSKLHQGIYRRVRVHEGWKLQPIILFVRPGTWSRMVDLEQLANEVATKTFGPEFEKEFTNAMATAR